MATITLEVTVADWCGKERSHVERCIEGLAEVLDDIDGVETLVTYEDGE